MNIEPTEENVVEALNSLYYGDDTVTKERSSLWLGVFQKSLHAWEISDKLLKSSHSLEVKYFAAQTIRTKIQYSFHELPVDVHESLRDSLLDLVGTINSTTPVVIATQLTLALADLILQMTTWENAVGSLIQRFTQNAENVPFLIELLAVLPEEVGSRSLRLGANRREKIAQSLKDTVPMLLELLSQCVMQWGRSDPVIQTKILNCLASWFTISAIPVDAILNSPLLQLPFEALCCVDCNHSLHEAAADCCCKILYSCEDLTNFSQLALKLVEYVRMLPPCYQAALASEDTDKCMNYVRIFTELAETCLTSMVDTPGSGLGSFSIIDNLVVILGHKDYEVAEITFSFWFRFSEVVFHKNDNELCKLFAPYVGHVVVCLAQHSTIDIDEASLLSSSSEFYDFRAHVHDLIMDLAFIPGSYVCFEKMVEVLNSSTDWNIQEAAYFVMSSVAKSIVPKESGKEPDLVSPVLERMLNCFVDSCHAQIQFTVLRVIAQLAEWISCHRSFLERVMQTVLNALQSPLLGPQAAAAMEKLSRYCGKHLAPHFSILFQLAESLDRIPSHLSLSCIDSVYKGIVTVLGYSTDEDFSLYLDKLLLMQTDHLRKLFECEDAKLKSPIPCLDKISSIFRDVRRHLNSKTERACAQSFTKVWPSLLLVLDRFAPDEKVVERCCRSIRYGIRAADEGGLPLLEPVAHKIVRYYASHRHSCYLYLASVLVDQYGHRKELHDGLLSMVQGFCPSTFSVLETVEPFRRNPNLWEDFFRLATRLVQKCPLIFLKSNLPSPLLDCAAAAAVLDHPDASSSLLRFIQEFAKAARNGEEKEDYPERSQLVRSLMKDHGSNLTNALLRSVLFCLPSCLLNNVSECFYEFLLLDRSMFSDWLHHSLSSLPSQDGTSASATPQQLQEFHTSFLGCKSPFDAPTVLSELSYLYR